MTKILNANVAYKSGLQSLNINNVQYIVIHHLAHSTASVEDIHQWHLEFGWSGIGYNEYIRKDGTVYICRGDNIGAHTLGYNERSFGIALEGNFDKDFITIEQYDALIERLVSHSNRFINLKFVCGHRDLCATSCPGKNISLGTILADIEPAKDKAQQDLIAKKEAEAQKEVQQEQASQHWADAIYQDLLGAGLIIHEKRFDDKITRGEVFALLNQLRKSGLQ